MKRPLSFILQRRRSKNKIGRRQMLELLAKVSNTFKFPRGGYERVFIGGHYIGSGEDILFNCFEQSIDRLCVA